MSPVPSQPRCVYLVSFMHKLKHRSCLHFSPPPLIFSRPQWSSCAPLSERSRRNALAQRLDTSWIPECALCRKALSLRDGAAPGFHGRAHKQEETLRESRYFTAVAHYKHPEPRKEAALDSQVNPQSRQRSSYHTELLLLRAALFCTYNGVFAFSFLAFSIQTFSCYEQYRKAISGLLNLFFLYIFQMFREPWRPMNFHSMRWMDQGMDGACWSVVNYW